MLFIARKEIKKIGRNHQVTIANIDKKNFDKDKIIKILSKSVNKVKYACWAFEKAPTTDMLHATLYIVFTNPIRQVTVSKMFENSHDEVCDGTHQQNISYVLKDGVNADKHTPLVDETFTEYGTRPVEKVKQEKETLTDIIYKYIEDGMTTTEMIRTDKRLINKIKIIETTRQLLVSEKYLKENRVSLETTYIEGPAGCGKTRMIYDLYDFSSIARITSYNSKRGVIFDNYDNFQDVLVFDDFDSKNVPIVDMLGYLDIYVIMLPARYFDRVACYTKCVLISNIPYEFQYSIEREWEPEKYKAFDRRIKRRIRFNYNDTIDYFTKKDDGTWEIKQNITLEEIKNIEKESEKLNYEK